jgi:hypothetical protein
MESVVIILLVVVAIVIAAVAFSTWALFAIIRGIIGIAKPKRTSSPIVHHQGRAVQMCNNVQCKCANPSHARFCRRCGKSLPSLLRVVSSRVAML